MKSAGRLKRYHIKDRNLGGQADRSKEKEAPAFFIYKVMYQKEVGMYGGFCAQPYRSSREGAIFNHGITSFCT
jgi:hypothetical protein